MIKCGILTFHNAGNFGASLQTYALRQILASLGCDCQVIDYTSPYHAPKPDVSVFDREFIRCITHGMIRTSYRYLRRQCELKKSLHGRVRAFDDFMEMYNITNKVESAAEINALELDMIVCGSDQIWCKLQDRYEPVFFAEGLNGYIISYAASGYSPDTGKPDEAFLSLINNYDMISVRETSLYTLLNESGIQCTLTCDPVFFAGREVIDRISKRIALDREYIFVYNLGRSDEVKWSGEIISKRYGVKMLYCDGVGAYADFDGCKVRLASPCEFIDAIKRAKCVVTNSFHGTVLSLLYHVPVVPTLFRNKSRVADMMETFGLSDRIITGSDDAENVRLDGIDYAEVDVTIEAMRVRSREYLMQAIEAAQRNKE